jgi:hypothetical protein
MRSHKLAGLYGLLAAGLLIGAQAVPVTAASVSFGADLSNSNGGPTGAESCSQDLSVPNGTACTWVAIDAAHNGGHEKAPKAGTIHTLSLKTCIGGSFVLQIARANESTHKAQIVRSGPTIRYQKDPRSQCGGNNGNYIIQSFSINVHVNKGDFIAVKAAKIGPIYNAGGTGVLLFHPTLPTGGSLKHANGDSSADLLIRLTY